MNLNVINVRRNFPFNCQFPITNEKNPFLVLTVKVKVLKEYFRVSLPLLLRKADNIKSSRAWFLLGMLGGKFKTQNVIPDFATGIPLGDPESQINSYEILKRARLPVGSEVWWRLILLAKKYF